VGDEGIRVFIPIGGGGKGRTAICIENNEFMNKKGKNLIKK